VWGLGGGGGNGVRTALFTAPWRVSRILVGHGIPDTALFGILLLFEIVSLYGLKLRFLLPQLPERWDYKCVPPYSAQHSTSYLWERWKNRSH
jgi:hypothetical protein